jgi:D-glycero-alpha-D-manno-heptose-7-phosphate kinase
MIISRTPLRMSFVGGGSDIHAYYQHGYGAVISTAINKYVYITVNKRFTDNIRVAYSKIEYVKTVDEIEHNLVREALKMTGMTKGLEIAYLSDLLPAHEGSGLGASSSIVVGTLHALHALKGEYVSADKLAKEACKIEIDILGHPIGKQDQYAAAFGGFNHIQFKADETVIVDPIIFKKDIKEKLNRNLIMFYIGKQITSGDVLTEQIKKTENKLHIYDKMVEQVRELQDALRNNDLTRFGEILHNGWMYKQQLASKISNPIINSYYEKARKAGAIGGKILGSGGGGFLLFYCDVNKQDSVRSAISDLKETPFAFEASGSRIIYVSD